MIRDIAVHFSGSRQDQDRIAYATHLAQTFDAHVTGFVENVLIEVPIEYGTAIAIDLTDAIAEAEARTARLVETARHELGQTGLRSEVQRVDAYLGGMADAIAQKARTADLFVGTLPYDRSTSGQAVAEAVLFGSGRGCFFVPAGSTPPRSYDRVLVAWKDTREAARAVGEALPFLHRATEVAVAIVEEHGAGEQLGEDVGADIGRYLSRHDIKAEIRKISGWGSVSDALANEARQFQADLVVMGGYGHSRFREWALGGVTRDLLHTAKIPVLMAH